MSRINGPVVHLRGDSDLPLSPDCPSPPPEPEDLKNLQKLEQLYIAVNLITREYPDITFIDRRVLAFFREAKLHFGIRSLEMVISRLKNVTRGILNVENLPLDELEAVKLWIQPHGNEWKQEESQLVKIYKEPKQSLRIEQDKADKESPDNPAKETTGS